jgi:hypothetical protein
MDWDKAIERNREALKRVLAMLVAMAGLAGDAAFTSPLSGLRGRSFDRASSSIVGREGRGDCEAIGVPGKIRPTLPRHLYRAVLRLLRPAEAAVRRLIVVAARGLVVTLPPARPRKAKPKPTILRNGVGTGILMPRGYRIPPPLTPPLKGEGVVNAASGLATSSIGANASESPSPLRGGVRGGGKTARSPGFRLFDPLPRWGRHMRPRPSGVPRISVPGFTQPFPIRLPDDPIDAARLSQRFTALASALDDLPGQARRFARWRARRDALRAQIRQGRQTGRAGRAWPLRPGRPPGGRQKPVHEVHEVLNVVHGLAFWVLNSPDTS